MTLRSLRYLAAACVFALAAAPVAATAQQPQQPPQQGGGQQGQPGGKDDPKKEKENEFVEAARVLGGPAANAECVWVGRRIVSLVYRDDLDTAFRHLDLYDRFGCPGGHIQATFRCLVRQPGLDATKAGEVLTDRIRQCWINPNLQPQTAAAPAPGQAAPSTGTNPQ
jgi:hypothetical protein